MGEPVVAHLAFLLLLAPAFAKGDFIGWCQYAGAHGAASESAVDKQIHVGIASGVPQAVPTWHRLLRVLSAALGLLQQPCVVFVAGSEFTRRRYYLQGRAVAGAELRKGGGWQRHQQQRWQQV